MSDCASRLRVQLLEVFTTIPCKIVYSRRLNSYILGLVCYNFFCVWLVKFFEGN